MSVFFVHMYLFIYLYVILFIYLPVKLFRNITQHNLSNFQWKQNHLNALYAYFALLYSLYIVIVAEAFFGDVFFSKQYKSFSSKPGIYHCRLYETQCDTGRPMKSDQR